MFRIQRAFERVFGRTKSEFQRSPTFSTSPVGDDNNNLVVDEASACLSDTFVLRDSLNCDGMRRRRGGQHPELIKRNGNESVDVIPGRRERKQENGSLQSGGVQRSRGGSGGFQGESACLVEWFCGCWLKLNYCYKAIIISVCLGTIILSLFGLYFGKINPKMKMQRIRANDSLLIPPNPEYPPPPSRSALHVFSNAAVCSDSEICSRIGRDTFTKGGSIVDATLATMFCLGITNMQSMGIGGGFFMNIYVKSERKAYTLDAREVTAGAAFKEMHLNDPKSTNEGPLSIATPGEMKGYVEAHKRFGKLPWKDLVAPAIKLCDEGFSMGKHMEDSLRINPIIKNDFKLRSMFYNETSQDFLRQGAWIKPDRSLCESLRKIAQRGGEDMYTGKLAEDLVEDLKDMGSIITKEDLEKYSVRWTESVPIDLGNETMFITPPPSSGILLGFIMKILKGYGFSPESISTVNSTILTYHRIVEAFKWAYGKRTEIGDPAFANLTKLMEDLKSDDVAEGIRLKIDDHQTSQDYKHYGGQFYQGNDNGTGHVSIIAPNGDAVSLTSSVNFYFGCGSMGKRTGIILNSGMDDFSSPGLKNYFGLPGSPNNYIEPRKRALNSMSPTIIVGSDGQVKLVLGAAGGTKIITSVAMTIIRTIWFGQNIKEAIDTPRFHHQLVPMYIEYEYGTQEQIVKGLEARGHKTQRYHHRGSIVCGIQQNSSAIYGNADFRKAGDVFGF